MKVSGPFRGARIESGDATIGITRRLQVSFVVLSLSLGTLLGVALPPFQANDEVVHFFSAYLIAEGDLLPDTMFARQGDILPRNIIRAATAFHGRIWNNPRRKPTPQGLVQRFKRLDRDAGDRDFFPFQRNYNPVSLAPQASAVALARGLGWPVWAQFYLGRFSGLLFWIGAVVLVLQITPILKPAIWLLALSPQCLASACSFSTDPFTTAMAWLFTAHVFRAALGPTQRLGDAWIVVLVTLGILLAVSKYAYLPLLGLCVLIPRARFSSTVEWAVMILLVAGTGLVSLALWNLFAGDGAILPQKLPTVSGERPVSYLAENPTQFVAATATSLVANASYYLKGLVGLVGARLVDPPVWVTVFYALGATALAIAGGPGSVKVTALHRVVILGVTGSIGLAIFAAAWWRWSPDPTVVWGVQGRYFLPIAPAALCAVSSSRLTLPSITRGPALIAMSIGVALALWVTTAAVVDLYWPELPPGWARATLNRL